MKLASFTLTRREDVGQMTSVLVNNGYDVISAGLMVFVTVPDNAVKAGEDVWNSILEGANKNADSD